MKRLWIVVLALGVFSCDDSTKQETISDDESQITVNKSEELESEKNKAEIVEDEEEVSFQNEVEFSRYCVEQIENGNFEILENYTNGEIMFSPYAFIEKKTSRKVSLTELSLSDDEKHFWGIYEGRGDSILLTTPEYLEKFVLDFDINKQKVEVNTFNEKPKAHGSELHNMQKVYPEAMYVEFYMPPSKEGYMDWKGLIFIVTESNGKYLLNAIVHNQWTP